MPLFLGAHLVSLVVRMLAGGMFPGWELLLAPLFEALLAAECREIILIERLHANRHTVHACAAISAKMLGLHAGGIGLERDFGIRCNGPEGGNPIQYGADGGRWHQRWRAPAEEDAGDGAPRRARFHPAQFIHKGLREARCINGRVPQDRKSVV